MSSWNLASCKADGWKHLENWIQKGHAWLHMEEALELFPYKHLDRPQQLLSMRDLNQFGWRTLYTTCIIMKGSQGRSYSRSHDALFRQTDLRILFEYIPGRESHANSANKGRISIVHI